MGPRGLREFLSLLELNGQLVRVREEILPEPDLRGYCEAVADMPENGPAILFNNIKGYRGKRLAVNLQGSWANCALMCGMPKNSGVRELFFELNTRFENSAR
jgi:UbiD family decarboxylase